MKAITAGRPAFFRARPIILERAPSYKVRLLKAPRRRSPGPISSLRARRSADASGRHAEFFFERGCEGTLIGKAVADGNFGDRSVVQALVGEILARTLQPLGANMRAHRVFR